MTDKELIKKAFQSLSVPVHEGGDWLVEDSKIRRGVGKRIFVLLLGSDIELEASINALKQMGQRDWRLTLGYSPAAEGLLDIESIATAIGAVACHKLSSDAMKDLKGWIESHEGFVIPNLTQNTLSKVAVGIQDDVPSLMIWQALATRKTVIANTLSIHHGWFSLESNPVMTQVMTAHMKQWEGFGAVLIEDHCYEELLRHQGLGKDDACLSQPGANGQGNTLAKDIKVITEYHVKQWQGSVLRIPKGILITPSARDQAKIRKIQLIQL